MKKEKIMISGILLALMIFIQACGLTSRTSYEKEKKQIYMSANANDIRSSGLFFSNVLESYKKAGVNFVTVSPKTVADYEALGKLSAITYSSLKINEDAVSQAIAEALSPYDINEKSVIVLSTNDDMTEYLRKNLIAKYSVASFTEVHVDETTTAFSLNNCEDKNLIIGYDEEELYLINEAGMTPCLDYPSQTYESGEYPEFFSEFLDEYKPAFIILRESDDTEDDLSDNMKKVLKKSNVALVITENENQISNEKPALLGSFRDIFGQKTVRGFSTDETDSKDKTLYMYRYYQWYNSVLERNTTFLNINILKNPNLESEYNRDYTLKAIDKLTASMKKLGYEFPDEFYSDKPYTHNLQTASMCGAVVMLALLYLYLSLLLGKKAEDKELYFLILCTVLIIFSFAFYNSITKYLALLIMILVSSLITLILFKLQISYIPFKTKLTSAIVSPICLLLTGAVSITSLLSDFDFSIGEKWFSPVVVSLVIPIILTFVNYLAVYIIPNEDMTEFKNDIITGVKKKPVYVVAMATVLIAAAFAYYLIRAGKSTLVLPFENKIRRLLTDIFVIRPRFKEFIIGYPAFALFIYYGFFKKKRQNKAITVFGILQILLFTSVLNTFCHASTLVWVNVSRTFKGFICGAIISGIIIAILEIITFARKKVKEKHESEKAKPKDEKEKNSKKAKKSKKAEIRENKETPKKEKANVKNTADTKKTPQKKGNNNNEKKKNNKKNKKK